MKDKPYPSIICARGFSYLRGLNEKGVALLLILWVLFLLSIISAEFAFSMRTDFAITLNFKEEMESYYLAQAGINHAIAKILHERMEYLQRQKISQESIDEEEVEKLKSAFDANKNLGSGTFTYELIDEEGKININSLKKNNTKDRQILRCLLEQAAGITDESMQNTIIDSIMDWIDPDDLFRPAGAEEDYYQELSPPYHCKNGPFDTVGELLLVQGITREILFGGNTSAEGEEKKYPGIGRYLTVWTGGRFSAEGEEKKYPGIGRYLTVWTGGRFDLKVANKIPIACKFSEEAADREMERRQEEMENPTESTQQEPAPSRHWTIKAVGTPRSGNSTRTIIAKIKVITQSTKGKKKQQIPTVKVLYWDDNYIDPFVAYEEPQEELPVEY
jgi:hypothetical protein